MKAQNHQLIPRKLIFGLLTVFIFVGISYGKKCYAPVICDDGEYTKPTWTEVSAPCQSETNLLNSKPGNTTGQKGEKGEMGVIANSTINALKKELAAQKTENEDINATIYDLQRVIRSFNGTVEFLKEENKKMKAENAKINETFTKLISELPMIDCKKAEKQKAIVWNETGGLFNIFRNGKLYEVYCDATTDGGGWTVFQRRMDGSVEFYRTWEEYADRFGNKAGEFWLGLENIYQLTLDGDYELRVDLTDWDGNTAFARYGTFSISGRSDNYRLTIGDYSGTAGDSMAYNNGQAFSAKDRDLDSHYIDCAKRSFGAWWFDACGYSNLNGRYNDTSSYQNGVCWYFWKSRWDYSLKASEMKFRKK